MKESRGLFPLDRPGLTVECGNSVSQSSFFLSQHKFGSFKYRELPLRFLLLLSLFPIEDVLVQ